MLCPSFCHLASARISCTQKRIFFFLLSVIYEHLYFWIFYNFAHQLANIRKTSSALGIFNCTRTSAGFLFLHYSFQNRRTSIFQDIFNNILSGITKTETDFFIAAVAVIFHKPKTTPILKLENTVPGYKKPLQE